VAVGVGLGAAVADGAAGACARLAAGVPGPDGRAVGERDGPVGLAEADAVVAAAEAEAEVGVIVGAADDDAGAGPVWTLPAPYIEVPVDWTAPGSRAMFRTVTVCPCVSVSRTVNGPEPAPDDAIQ
jgi:hypothetical protein